MSSLLWDQLKYPLRPFIKNAIDSLGFETMTPVQASTIPLFSGNKDVVVESYTGSGKTVAFVIPILERLLNELTNTKTGKLDKLPKGHFHTLVIAPTRELSSQIHSVLEYFLEFYESEVQKNDEENTEEEKDTATLGTDVVTQQHFGDISSMLLVGGDSKKTIREDYQSFMEKKPQILIGTPGRVLDFLKIQYISTKSCNCVVLDEADRLLDESFLKDTEKILQMLPKQRRTGLFSATISSAGLAIFKTGMRNPVKVSVKPSLVKNVRNVGGVQSGSVSRKNPTKLEINYVVLKPEYKLKLLLKIFQDFKYKKIITYFPTCLCVEFFYKIISHLKPDLKIYSLHGKLNTNARQKTLDNFTSNLNPCILLTTDVAARGIDIPHVDMVLQMDPPTDSDIFLHRCGRTGRANQSGHALVFLNKGREEDYVEFLQVKNIDITPLQNKLDDDCLDSMYDLQKDVLQWSLQDRARFDDAIKAFVSFIRYYSKHSATSIFRLQSLDYIGLAKLYGLIRLPKMPEIDKYCSNLKSSNNNTDTDTDDTILSNGWLISQPIDMKEYKYLNKQKEEKRLKDLQNLQKIKDKNKLKTELKKKNMAWSNNTDTKEKKLERREKMSLKRNAIEEKLKQEEQKKQNGMDSEEEEQVTDWKDMVRANKKRKQDSSVQGSFDDL
ncbi:hypothetical protein ACO0RG_003685 [Hanseniaspora osmophila]